MESTGIPEPGGSGNPANLCKSSPFLAPESSNGSKTQDQSCVLKSSRLLPLLWHWRKCNGSALTSSYNKPSTFRKFIPLTALCLWLPGQNPPLSTATWVKLKDLVSPSLLQRTGETEVPPMLQTPKPAGHCLEKMCPAVNPISWCREMWKTLYIPTALSWGGNTFPHAAITLTWEQVMAVPFLKTGFQCTTSECWSIHPL